MDLDIGIEGFQIIGEESDRIATVTTISTPHNGSKTIDFFLRFPKVLLKAVSKIVDIIHFLLGDEKPQTYEAICSLSTKYALQFNDENRDIDSIYYQSYAFVMKSAFSDLFLCIPYLVVKAIEGENDGLLTPEAVKWGEFQGVFTGVRRRGISHADEVDLRRRPFSRKKSDNENEISDIKEIYERILDTLASKGY